MGVLNGGCTCGSGVLVARGEFVTLGVLVAESILVVVSVLVTVGVRVMVAVVVPMSVFWRYQCFVAGTRGGGCIQRWVDSGRCAHLRTVIR